MWRTRTRAALLIVWSGELGRRPNESRKQPSSVERPELRAIARSDRSRLFCTYLLGRARTRGQFIKGLDNHLWLQPNPSPSILTPHRWVCSWFSDLSNFSFSANPAISRTNPRFLKSKHRPQYLNILPYCLHTNRQFVNICESGRIMPQYLANLPFKYNWKIWFVIF